MKAIKMIGLVALTALAAMAFVGASSAMAESTALCSEDTTEDCEALSHVHETSVGKAKLLSSFGTTECDALVLGDVKSNGKPMVLEVNLTYSNCKLGGTNCTATEENGPAEVKVLKKGHETTEVTGEGLVKLVCGESLNCAYNGLEMVGTGKGPLLSAESNPNGEVTTSEKTANKEAGGFLCPKTSKLDITLTPLEAAYINGGLGYCAKSEHTNGIYTNNTCTTRGSTPATHNYTYALVVTSGNPVVGTTRCYAVLRPFNYGLWATRTAGVCGSDNPSRTSPYEKGVVEVVH